ncbi:Retrovirus-related Pol polyprotein from transposon TNT 1-94 [Vitis vinifera]|uniref:Retrovirus-related Pol polyprotein from transposon TNT 1-94 n=1 Tax=Vitis vinifera TaxID=29760 RepID=A0A438CFP4_VITVI|nr:Retrovirus-related Pol polyprotein from transposon TNT 1-94 [Vitis vinifera]
MPGSPPQNGVAERRNRTLKDIVRSMRRNSKLPESIFTEALETTVYILNRVPTNVVLKTPFELWKDHIDAQPSTSSDRLIVIHNAPQVQTSDGQPIIEVPQTTDDNPVDQVVQDSQIVEQPVEQHDPSKMLIQH